MTARALARIDAPLGAILLAPGPLATFDAPVPGDPSLAGFELSTQAVHLGGIQPFALSNARDLVVGLSIPGERAILRRSDTLTPQPPVPRRVVVLA